MGKKKPPAKSKGNGRHAPEKKPTPGCYVLSLTVENIRCFGPKQTLDCSDGEGRPRQWTVILGDNGTGKTTALRLIAIHRSISRNEMPDILYSRHDKAIGFTTTELVDRSFGITSGVKNSKTMTLGTIDISGVRLEAWRSTLGHDEHALVGYWRLAAYGASRRLPTYDDYSVPSRGDNPLESLFHPLTRLRDAESWIKSLDYHSKLTASQSAVDRRDLAMKALIDVLPEDVADFRYLPGIGGNPNPHVEFFTDYGWVPLRQLGHGYQTMIAWVTDFMSRMFEWYPDSENPLAEPAVCLVDEIDLHLHPVWQRKVIGYLSERFPNTQFIVTAHSPLVVQAAASANANIAVLVRSTETDADGNHYVEIRNNPEDVRNWRLDQILTSDLFGGLSLNPPNVEELFKEKEHLLGLTRPTPKQKERLIEIDDRLAKLPVGDDAREVKEMQAIREALAHLHKRPAK